MTIRLNQTVKPMGKIQSSQKDNTEEKILNAAQTVFIRKGMDGSRMQEIADEAGINKALLHYYFRTKQKLFEAIFQKLFRQIFPNIESLILSDTPIREKLEIFIDKYNELLWKHPYLPAFVLREIHRDPEFLVSVIRNQGVNPAQISEIFEREMEAGHIRKMDPRDLMVNIISLSIFPYAAKPLMNVMFFENDKKAYRDFLKKRNETIKEFVFNSILIK